MSNIQNIGKDINLATVNIADAIQNTNDRVTIEELLLVISKLALLKSIKIEVPTMTAIANELKSMTKRQLLIAYSDIVSKDVFGSLKVEHFLNADYKIHYRAKQLAYDMIREDMENYGNEEYLNYHTSKAKIALLIEKKKEYEDKKSYLLKQYEQFLDTEVFGVDKNKVEKEFKKYNFYN